MDLSPVLSRIFLPFLFFLQLFSQALANSEGDYWCYHCASPRKNEEQSMLDAMDQLLALRKTAYPLDRVAIDCSRPHNYSLLQKDRCRFPWCSQITFDDGKGLPLTIRGCAERMMAMGSPRAECSTLHKKLNIRECVCHASERICGQNSAAYSQHLPSITSTLLLFIVSPLAVITRVLDLL